MAICYVACFLSQVLVCIDLDFPYPTPSQDVPEPLFMYGDDPTATVKSAGGTWAPGTDDEAEQATKVRRGRGWASVQQIVAAGGTRGGCGSRGRVGEKVEQVSEVR